MPITQAEVMALIKGSNSPTKATLIKETDAKLKDPEWVRAWRCGTDAHPYWRVVVRGSLTPKDKEDLVHAYTEAGWSKVVVSNSDESDEAPGMCGIALHA